MGVFEAVLFEDAVGVRILLGERVAANTVMQKKFLNLHGCVVPGPTPSPPRLADRAVKELPRHRRQNRA